MPKLPRNSTFQLHKIAQEAVSNSIKHGKATQVSVQLSCEHGRLVLTIRNDGIPFEQPSEPRNRMGLRIMNYRANTIGATFEINGIPGEGTVVTCTLPLGNGVSIRRPGLESQEAEVPEPSMA
ncbi:MAG TPA: ATP-binding protein [Polyangiaceae bacterium]|nr:ATP-binding protein [Polyangiaceae bacterium]